MHSHGEDAHSTRDHPGRCSSRSLSGHRREPVDRPQLVLHTAGRVYQSVILAVWDAIRDVAPFGFRVLTDIATYVQDASVLGVEWQAAVDEQLLQKVLPKIKGTDPRIGGALEQFAALMAGRLSPEQQQGPAPPCCRPSAARRVGVLWPRRAHATSGVIRGPTPWPGRVSSAWSAMLTGSQPLRQGLPSVAHHALALNEAASTAPTS